MSSKVNLIRSPLMISSVFQQFCAKFLRWCSTTVVSILERVSDISIFKYLSLFLSVIPSLFRSPNTRPTDVLLISLWRPKLFLMILIQLGVALCTIFLTSCAALKKKKRALRSVSLTTIRDYWSAITTRRTIS